MPVPVAQKDSDGLVPDGVAVHSAIPQSWGLSASSKKTAAMALVVAMVIVSIFGSYLQIIGSVNMSWDCVAVGS